MSICRIFNVILPFTLQKLTDPIEHVQAIEILYKKSNIYQTEIKSEGKKFFIIKEIYLVLLLENSTR